MKQIIFALALCVTVAQTQQRTEILPHQREQVAREMKSQNRAQLNLIQVYTIIGVNRGYKE